MNTKAIRSRAIVTVTEWELCDELDATRARLALVESALREAVGCGNLRHECDACGACGWADKAEEVLG